MAPGASRRKAQGAYAFAEDVRAGLTAEPKTLPCKYFYDARGSRLFDRICGLEEYYLTRTEIAIMQARVNEIVEAIGPRSVLIEYGSGSSLKTRILLDHLEAPVAYVPIDIAREHLARSAKELRAAYPTLRVLPVCADYSSRIAAPELDDLTGTKVVYFPGSTIGNMDLQAAANFLSRIADLVGERGGLLVGVDLEKDRDVMVEAYNDEKGISAAFNKNILRRANRELGMDFDLSLFTHRALYNEDAHRIESYLVSRIEQEVHLDDTTIHFDRGETIHTENSHKYTLERFATLARSGGFMVERVWTDSGEMFSVQLLRPV